VTMDHLKATVRLFGEKTPKGKNSRRSQESIKQGADGHQVRGGLTEHSTRKKRGPTETEKGDQKRISEKGLEGKGLLEKRGA